MPGLINLDFADVRSVMGEMGKAMMGTGEASGDNRAIEAAEKAIANPLLDGVSMKGAKGVIISITGGEDMRLMEVDEAANHIKELVDPDANIIWGSAFNTDLDGKIRVSVVATGIEADQATMPEPAKLFTFPSARKTDAAPAAQAEAPAPVAAPTGLTADLPGSEELGLAPGDIVAPTADDELLLDSGTILTPPIGADPLPLRGGVEQGIGGAPGSRPYVTTAAAAPRPREGGTLFERMSSIARGASKVSDEDDHGARGGDPLDIPRFLNRQSNQ
jgi:cell division protein FtsZ